ncbi:MAG: efflux RND transporter periplasmic adaptor subunit [Rikenellaceae bacterium]|nr:efflux RND transporter periplasmic adaptor subunit [Rikenellaceae bacterium]
MKKVLIILGILAVCGILYFVLRPKEKSALVMATVRVEPTTLNNFVTATGTIEPIIQVEVGTQVSGIVSHIYVDFNSEVKTGQVIAVLDKVLLEAELASSQSNLESAKVEYEYQLQNYNRMKGLHEKQMISDSEFETVEYSYYKAVSAYEKSKADNIKAEKNLGYATITSPIDGVVLSRDVDEGQTVASSFSTPTLFTIANDLRNMQVIANVDEADIGQVKEGQRVTFTVDAFPDDVFEGSITQVRLQPTTESNVVTYEVVVDAPNPDLILMPGLTANITVYTLELQDVLVVPNKALRFVPGEGNVNSSTGPMQTLWLKKEDDIVPVQVTTGTSDGIYTHITSGLTAGDVVVVGYEQASAMNEVQENGGGDNNPFMPQRPGGNRRR